MVHVLDDLFLHNRFVLQFPPARPPNHAKTTALPNRKAFREGVLTSLKQDRFSGLPVQRVDAVETQAFVFPCVVETTRNTIMWLM